MNQERVKAIITIVVTAAVNIANILGYAWDMDAILNGVLTVFSFACIAYSWWFNQNVTSEAIQAQGYLDELKAAKHSKGNSMGRKETMVQTAIDIANDDSHGYSQYRRFPWEGTDFDCSSLMYWSAHAAGYAVPLSGYTGTMYDDFTAAGFTAYRYGSVELERGDILLAHNSGRQHTEMYIGDGNNVGAHIAETGDIDGAPGDQTGNEISISPNWGSWDWVLRPPADEQPHQEPGDPANDAGLYYRVHAQNLGWLDPVHDGQVAGTTGFGLRMEAIKCTPPAGWLLEISVHVENVGWEAYQVGEGSDPVIGTEGMALRMEDVMVRVLKRPAGDKRKLWFRVHQQNVGWKGWTQEGFASGTDGMAIRLEAIQMKIE